MTRKRSNNVHDSLVLDCTEDDLSDVQVEIFRKAELEQLEFIKRLENLHQENELRNGTTKVLPATQAPLVIQTTQPQHSNIVVLEPKSGMHLVVGNTPNAQSSGNAAVTSKNTAIRFTSPIPNLTRPKILSQTRIVTTPNTSVRAHSILQKVPTTTGNLLKIPSNVGPMKVPTPTAPTVPKTQLKSKAPTPDVSASNKSNKQPPQPAAKTSNDIVDLTDDDIPEENTADQNEVEIGKVSEKTFPSLVVNVRVCLRSKDVIPTNVAGAERIHLDASVKKVLMLSPTSFTEWLIQQGLLKCEQVCTHHRAPNGQFLKLKLGMYSDASKFPYSGGYVWIGECCPAYVSVFSGSIFQGAPHPPTVLLKIIYHWACQTAVQNVLHWVKVDNLYVKTLYTNLRAVCTAAIHEKYGKLGGPNKKVEVGVISLGTTTQGGHTKHIKVEVLGVYEPETMRLRLKALEPINENKLILHKKFLKILEPLVQWVEKDSILITDFTVDKAACFKMGFKKVIQSTHGTLTSPDQPTNQTIMDYLRKVIPKMFQNTLSLLSRQIIQQFLDELVWRETWGPIPSRAYDNIIQHIAEQTRLSSGTLIYRLARIAANPLKNWKYEKWAMNNKINVANATECEGGMLTSSLTSTVTPDQNPTQVQILERALTSSSISPTPPLSVPSEQDHESPLQAALIALEPYYYGALEGDPNLMTEKYFHTFKCIICKVVFHNVMNFTDHLIAHALNKSVHENSDTKELCKLCLKICPKSMGQSLSTHRQQVHNNQQTCTTLCKICSIRHKDVKGLQAHMIATHYELDMPYHCDICNYRTSILESIHQHFTTVHQKGTKGYCAFCLKLFQFATSNGKNLEVNQLGFVNHIQKHKINVNKKCEKCLLNFTNISLLKEHQDKWHQTCKLLDDVMRYTDKECTLMAAPLVDPLPNVTASVESAYKGTIRLNFDTTDKYCCECDGVLTSDHFAVHLTCPKCRYQTCCNNAMREHGALVHSNSLSHLRQPIIGRAPIIEKVLYCNCGYSNRNGNYMASHLVGCEIGDEVCGIGKTPFAMVEIKQEKESSPVHSAKRRKYEDGY